MFELRLGWYAPHRAGNWRSWLFSFGRHDTKEWTFLRDICVFGVTLTIVIGWGAGEGSEQ